MNKKNIILIILSIFVSLIFIGFDFFMQKKELQPEGNISFKMSELDIEDISRYIEMARKDNDAVKILGDWELWRYPKPKIEEKEEKKEKKHYVIYKVLRHGNREAIVNPEDRNEIWEFYGVFIVNKKPFAIFVNPKLKNTKYKIVTVGDKLNDNLLIDKITKSKIYIKFPVAENKFETLELKVFYVDLEQFTKKLKKGVKK